MTSKQSKIDEARIALNAIRPQPYVMNGGFLPLAALAPLAMAAGLPLAGKAGSWLGHKIFGNGIKQAGAGILRAGDRSPCMQGKGINDRLWRVDRDPSKETMLSNWRPGDFPEPKYQLKPHVMYHSQLRGGLIANMPGVPQSIKSIAQKVSMLGGKKKKTASRKKKN